MRIVSKVQSPTKRTTNVYILALLVATRITSLSHSRNNKLPKIQKCRNGCGTDITVQLDEQSGKYKPYEVDDNGEYYDLHNCPNSEYNRNKGSFGGGQKTNFVAKPQYTKPPPTPTDVPKTSQGGLPLDTKRLLQQVMELVKEIRELREETRNNVQIDSARYENQMDIIYNRLSKETQDEMFKTAADIDPITTKHSQIADAKQNFMQPRKDRVPTQQTKFVDESKQEKTLDERIPDDPEEFAVAQALKEDDEEGVIDEE